MKRSPDSRRARRKRRREHLVTGEGIPARKISETLLDFAEPLLSLLQTYGAANLPPEVLERQLKVSITIWNASVLEALGDMPGALAQARAVVAASGMPMMLALVDELIERKRSLFGDDYRLIGNYRVRRTADGAFNIQAEARWRGRPRASRPPA